MPLSLESKDHCGTRLLKRLYRTSSPHVCAALLVSSVGLHAHMRKRVVAHIGKPLSQQHDAAWHPGKGRGQIATERPTLAAGHWFYE
jgi:hypothetical protein